MQRRALPPAIMALAQVYDKIATRSAPFQGREEFGSMAALQKLAGRTFPSEAMEALLLVVTSA